MRNPDNGLLPDDTDYARMKRDLLTAIAVDDRYRTRKHRIAVFGIASALTVATTAGVMVIARAPQGQVNYTADCYASADLGAKHGTSAYLPGYNSAVTTLNPLAERVQLAEEMCAATWRIGTFRPGQTVPQGAVYPVPQLVACQLPDLRLAVFPSAKPAGKLCPELGLTTPRE